MGEHAGEFQPPPPAAPAAPVPEELQQFYTRADATIADLDEWGKAIADPLGLSWGPTPAEREGGGRA